MALSEANLEALKAAVLFPEPFNHHPLDWNRYYKFIVSM